MQDSKTKAVIEHLLASPEAIAEFAKLNGLLFEYAKKVLEELTKSPNVSEESQKYIWESGKEKEPLKDYITGEERGQKGGHSTGFGRGVVAGIVLSVIATFAFAVAKKKDII